MNKLYVLVDENLEPSYRAVQSGHAAVQWVLDHPDQEWNNNYLIFLKGHLQTWIEKLKFHRLDFTVFREPDRGKEITALACLCDGRIFKKAKLN